MKRGLFAASAALMMVCTAAAAKAGPSTFDHSHGRFDALLMQHVRDGRVDYRGLGEQRTPLDLYLGELAAVTASEYSQWSRPEQLAMWMNAYNALTLRHIIDHYPLERHGIKGLFFPSNSIWQIPGVWKDLKAPIAGRELALDDIEHGILRTQFDEPRIHAALVCAARSCPELRNGAYHADRLDLQLDDQVRRFLADSDKGLAIDTGKGVVRLSRIFKWFGEDFIGQRHPDGPFASRRDTEAGVLSFVARSLPEGATRDFLLRNDFKLRYFDYDWTLNERP